ncbi:uncharacterized protein SPPG_00586 [Spizellomyces punctatus DAOM BR117]|uniref:Uncharacterized protein n=1 Tax=Spizellomyces punctatus (strain DAOM BR117) TaxID=645134 RepID=A0A0L0HVH3_SPIPD|nr:uncharacterized protein SPPG_00586 [Spizellomyces punctatus DAOM BR117]KND04889.1 hypothetical protein SPPG_00586 [Spizellomyces punctatus DAOM BR117]|eukprot:XP_016612928.1 hypothetical protein SPPG_00586 [Spizellomyces punctatus DAOM BR117]
MASRPIPTPAVSKTRFPLKASPSASPLALSFLPPTRPSSHPLILLNPYTSRKNITAIIDEAQLSPPSDDVHVPMTKIEPFVHTRQVGGVFVRGIDAGELGLAPLGEADTCYGRVQRYSSVVAIVFGRQAVIENVYELPAAFKNTQYAEGVIGMDTLWSLGLNVAVDRGMVYLQDPELSQYVDHGKSA